MTGKMFINRKESEKQKQNRVKWKKKSIGAIRIDLELFAWMRYLYNLNQTNWLLRAIHFHCIYYTLPKIFAFPHIKQQQEKNHRHRFVLARINFEYVIFLSFYYSHAVQDLLTWSLFKFLRNLMATTNAQSSFSLCLPKSDTVWGVLM